MGMKILRLGKYRFTPLQIAAHLAAWLLVGWLLFDYFSGRMSVNPIQDATQRTGRYAIALLVLSLACTPLNTLFAFRQALTARRTLGLYAFMFVSFHLTLLVGVDYGFDLPLLLGDLATKRYILAGFPAFLILLSLAVTSFRWWMKRLGKNWKRLHRLVYLASILAVIHYAWAAKGNLLGLQGDILKPAFYALAVALLLLVRLPLIRRSTSSLHVRLMSRTATRAAPPPR
jgi:methionine sulfoxide reductase heme-binding subunit